MAELEKAELIDTLILAAEGRPYAWGENDCLTLALQILAVAGLKPESFSKASSVAAEYLTLSYPEALELARRRGATIGEVMLRVARDLGLETVGGDAFEPRCGSIAFAEGEIRRLDDHVHDTAKAGTLDLFFGSAPSPFAWTTAGLKPYHETFKPDFRSLEITGAVNCLPQ